MWYMLFILIIFSKLLHKIAKNDYVKISTDMSCHLLPSYINQILHIDFLNTLADIVQMFR